MTGTLHGLAESSQGLSNWGMHIHTSSLSPFLVGAKRLSIGTYILPHSGPRCLSCGVSPISSTTGSLITRATLILYAPSEASPTTEPVRLLEACHLQIPPT